MQNILSKLTGLTSNIETPNTAPTVAMPKRKFDQRTLDNTNNEFYRAACRADTAPIFNIYDGNERTSIVRAAVEQKSDTATPIVVSTTSGSRVKSDRIINSSSISTSNNSPSKEAFIPPHLKMYQEPVVVFNDNDKTDKKKISSKQSSQERVDLIPKSDELAFIDESRMSHTTQHALQKSQKYMIEIQQMTSKIAKSKFNADIVDEKINMISVSSESLPALRPPAPLIGKTIAFSEHEIKSYDRVTGMKTVQSAPQLLPSLQGRGSHGDAIHMQQVSSYLSDDNSEAKEFDDMDRINSVPKYVKPAAAENDSENVDGFQNKSSWENDIARYILSMFATSKMQEQRALSSQAILEFIDNEDMTNTKDLVDQGILDNLDKKEKAVIIAAKRPPSRGSKGKHKGLVDDDKLKSNKTTGNVTPKGSATKKADSGKGYAIDHKDPVTEAAMKGIQSAKTFKKATRDPMHSTGLHPNMPNVIRAPTKAFPIWFSSSGDIYAEWLSLPNGDRLQSLVDKFRERKQYKEYLMAVQDVLEDSWIDSCYYVETNMNSSASEMTYCSQTKDLSKKIITKSESRIDMSAVMNSDGQAKVVLSKRELTAMWQKLVLTANAFATLLIERKDFPKSMQILQLVETWMIRDDIFATQRLKVELKSYVNNTLANYFFRRKMTKAAFSHTKLALTAQKKLKLNDCVATSLLHLSCCEYQVSHFKEAHRVSK